MKLYINAGVNPHTVMAWSVHRTESMLRSYHIIDLDGLRRAGRKASESQGPKETATALRLARYEGGAAQNGAKRTYGHNQWVRAFGAELRAC